MNQIAVLLRREFWEHRAIAIVPLVFGVLFVAAALLSVVGLVRFSVDIGEMTITEMARHVRPDDWKPGMQVAFLSLAGIFQAVMIIVVLFYLADALYAERRDRSILFWKSLPVRDSTVVASKFLTAAAVAPAFALAVFVATVVLIWLVAGITVLVLGESAALTAGPAALLAASALMAWSLIAQSLWYAPVYAWVLLASAFARRAALLWVLLPPVGLIIAERTLLGSGHFARLIAERLGGAWEHAFAMGGRGGLLMGEGAAHVQGLPMLGELVTPGRFFGSPGLWAGLLVALAFLAAATALRRWRDEG